MYSKRYFLTLRYKITLYGLTCRYNQSKNKSTYILASLLPPKMCYEAKETCFCRKKVCEKLISVDLKKDFVLELNVDWLIDFNGISNCLRLFYASRLENGVYCRFLFLFLCTCFLRVCFLHTTIYQVFLSNTNNLYHNG